MHEFLGLKSWAVSMDSLIALFLKAKTTMIPKDGKHSNSSSPYVRWTNIVVEHSSHNLAVWKPVSYGIESIKMLKNQRE